MGLVPPTNNQLPLRNCTNSVTFAVHYSEVCVTTTSRARWILVFVAELDTPFHPGCWRVGGRVSRYQCGKSIFSDIPVRATLGSNSSDGINAGTLRSDVRGPSVPLPFAPDSACVTPGSVTTQRGTMSHPFSIYHGIGALYCSSYSLVRLSPPPATSPSRR